MSRYPLIKVEVSSASHPFYTGKKIFVDTAGRVEKFNQKYKAKQAVKQQEVKKEAPAAEAPKEEVKKEAPAAEAPKEEVKEEVKEEAPAAEAPKKEDTADDSQSEDKEKKEN